jgi:hypothetical protein
MEKVRVVDSGIEKFLSYTEKYAHGIFIVIGDNKLVKRNCELLNIELGENVNPLEMKQRVTKLEKTGILTTRLMDQHFQYIIKDYASKGDVEELISGMPDPAKEALRAAYNLTKMNNMEDINFLGGALDNKN